MAAPLNILCISRITPAERARVEAVDPQVRVIDVGGWFDGEMWDTWPREACERFIHHGSTGHSSRAERDALLAEAEIALVDYPFPMDLRARAPGLKWVHQRPAGASNQRAGDLWGREVTVTTSRGHASSLPIAEFVVAGFLHFARGFHQAQEDRHMQAFDKGAYQPALLTGKTVCVVGAGGIGMEVGRLCAALDMRVLGTRHRVAALPPGFTEIHGPEALHGLLAETDFVAICCQWTPETEKLIGTEAFAAMKPGAVLVNVARGEIIDEAALLRALAADRLRGVVLDVYRGEFEGPPDSCLWQDPKVLITPHVSNGSDVPGGHLAMDVFCRNLEAYVRGGEMENVIDWSRGY